MREKINLNNKGKKFEPIADQLPPDNFIGFGGWIKKNLFYSKVNTILTLLLFLSVSYILINLLDWIVFNADWIGEDRTACSRVGACWVFIDVKLNQFLYGFYPKEEYWRPNLVGLLFFVFLIPFLFKNLKYKIQWLFAIVFLYPTIAFTIIHGGLGLPIVGTLKWGGLMLTILVAYVGIVVSFPIGVILALGRASNLPVPRFFSVIFIEIWRGVPLITILFMASNLFPLFFPEGVDVNKMVRALIGITLFQSAYIAEVVRGGLQAIPKGQHEASDSLGLPYWSKIFNIILPQAIRIVIPSIVGSSISLFKDTTLLLIIGLLDVLAIVNASTSDINWMGFESEGYVFVGFLFWIFCYSMSRYSVYLEKKLSLDNQHKK